MRDLAGYAWSIRRNRRVPGLPVSGRPAEIYHAADDHGRAVRGEDGVSLPGDTRAVWHGPLARRHDRGAVGQQAAARPVQVEHPARRRSLGRFPQSNASAGLIGSPRTATLPRRGRDPDGAVALSRSGPRRSASVNTLTCLADSVMVGHQCHAAAVRGQRQPVQRRSVRHGHGQRRDGPGLPGGAEPHSYEGAWRLTLVRQLAVQGCSSSTKVRSSAAMLTAAMVRPDVGWIVASVSPGGRGAHHGRDRAGVRLARSRDRHVERRDLA